MITEEQKELWKFIMDRPSLVLRSVPSSWIEQTSRIRWSVLVVNGIRQRSKGYARIGANRVRRPYCASAVLAMLDLVAALGDIWRAEGPKAKKLLLPYLNGSEGQPERKAGLLRRPGDKGNSYGTPLARQHS